MTSAPDDIPSDLRARWSAALTAAGLFDEALRIHPADTGRDVLRRGELAVLALDHATAQRELKELDGARDPAVAPDPWQELLLRAARVMSGEPDGMSRLQGAVAAVRPAARVQWVLALAAQSVGDLGPAGDAAARARHGGVRDARLLGIEAAAVMAEGDLARALDLTRRAQHTALADEDPAGFTTQLLIRADRRDAAVRLAAAGAVDRQLPQLDRAAWQSVARGLGVGSRRGAGIASRQERRERRRRADAARSLVCRCWGSGGWLGAHRLHYVEHHLGVVVPQPVAGLEARLLRCPATAILFLDFPARQITLPVSVGG